MQKIYREVLPSLFLGLIAFLFEFPLAILNPSNIAWLSKSDPATYYLSWLFFEHSPWMWPPGANPKYGLELGSSIYYTDCVPLLALACKVMVAPLFKGPFQYNGLWLLICFLLQSWFGWKLAGLLTPKRLGQFFICGLFIFTPCFLWRLTIHFALAAHWVILAALYLSFGSPRLRRHLYWPCLAGLTAGINAYLLLIILLLWMSDLGRRILEKEITVWNVSKEAAWTSFTILGVFWMCGTFLIHRGFGGEDTVFGRMNLFSLVNPGVSLDGTSWSYIFPTISEDKFDYEGFNFLGLGVLGLMSISGFLWLSYSRRIVCDRKWIPLASVCCILTLFALTKVIYLGNREIFHYFWPRHIHLEAFRSAGRMFWPVLYVLLFVSLQGLIRQTKPGVATVLLGVFLLLQIMDTSKGWLAIHQRIREEGNGSVWNTPMHSSFWEEAARKYKRVDSFPAGQSEDPPYEFVAYYAGLHGLGTTAAYMARVNFDRSEALVQRERQSIISGQFDKDTLYILNGEAESWARKSYNPRRDLLEKIDGLNVLAPGWENSN